MHGTMRKRQDGSSHSNTTYLRVGKKVMTSLDPCLEANLSCCTPFRASVATPYALLKLSLKSRLVEMEAATLLRMQKWCSFDLTDLRLILM